MLAGRLSGRGWARLLTRALALVCAAALFLAVPSCASDECILDEVRCHDNAAQTCIQEEGGRGTGWSSRPCDGGFCRLPSEPEGVPFCAQTREPVEECGSGRRSACRDNEVIDCREGYVVHALDCTTGKTYPDAGDFPQPELILDHASAPTGYCRARADAALCALEREPNPLCGGFSGTACEGNQWLNCVVGYLASRDDCGDEAVCFQVDTATARCDPL